jgi:dTDP-4-amino-4,6-dideoxy-D-galactose acyltransferase
LQILEWDSNFFGKKIARANVEKLTENSLHSLLSESIKSEVDCLYLLLNAADKSKVKLAEMNGFHLVDIRVTLARSIEPELSPWVSPSSAIRLAKADDIINLRSIAAANHKDSRFYSDGNFPAELCDELYATWIEKSCNGYADAVLVADRGEGAIGYTSCHIRENGVGNIGLVGISDKCQGQGLGKLLLAEALSWFAANGVKKVEVITQGKNIGAQRLYQKCSFMTAAMELWFHKWLQSPPENIQPATKPY